MTICNGGRGCDHCKPATETSSPRRARWRTAWFCVACIGQLTWSEVMRSHGRCPLCGYKDPAACTIVKTFDRGYRVYRQGFWRRRQTEWTDHAHRPEPEANGTDPSRSPGAGAEPQKEHPENDARAS